MPARHRRVPPAESVLEAVLERVTYANEETGYTVARVPTERSGGDPSLIKLVRTGRAVLDGLETVSTSVGSGSVAVTMWSPSPARPTPSTIGSAVVGPLPQRMSSTEDEAAAAYW